SGYVTLNLVLVGKLQAVQPGCWAQRFYAGRQCKGRTVDFQSIDRGVQLSLPAPSIITNQAR
ncbi:MAG TPA: hypothetical protein VFM18_14905, partial [Methanosarcina sp.]|nr:hypothetical protein [Methanosarcina sp.]